jgi:hypothetical protein
MVGNVENSHHHSKGFRHVYHITETGEKLPKGLENVRKTITVTKSLKHTVIGELKSLAQNSKAFLIDELSKGKSKRTK